MVRRASENYGMPFKAGSGVAQGGQLSAKNFNNFVDAIAHECVCVLLASGYGWGTVMLEISISSSPPVDIPSIP